MVIGEDSKKIQVVMSREEAKALKQLAEKEDRSVSNFAYIIIKKELERLKK